MRKGSTSITKVTCVSQASLEPEFGSTFNRPHGERHNSTTVVYESFFLARQINTFESGCWQDRVNGNSTTTIGIEGPQIESHPSMYWTSMNEVNATLLGCVD